MTAVRQCLICKVNIDDLDTRRRYCYSDVCKKRSACLRTKRHCSLYPERNKATIRRYAATEHGRAMLLLNNAKDRAKRQGITIDIDFEFVLEKLRAGVCEITGTPFEFTVQDKFRANPLSPSLDRIIPNRGYIKTNVRMVCFAVNVMHHDWPDEIMLKMAKLIVDNQRKLHLED